ncbi:hypothetical protein OBBRIDRAFT_137351 [Obba rivulosa]|uniref:Nephrocystin 3-like N-terminal domain-containing protein n=1 Tax=Obba rivulosa TaxID=1052685 RepID=A0A8E2AQX9_9APHY|nr:hypothetical protein OBBRIDRAFT_137351 [Obba rivulosa]
MDYLKMKFDISRTQNSAKTLGIAERREVRDFTKDEQDILRGLQPVDASWRYSGNAAKALLYPGSRQEVIDGILTWAQQPVRSGRVCIMQGPEGIGKSTIAYAISHSFEETGCLGASYFFDRASDERADPHRVFRTIAHQLAQLQPELRPYLVKAAEEHLKRGIEQSIEHQAEDLFTTPLSTIAPEHLPRHPIIILFDALDECSPKYRDGLPRMLRHLLGGLDKIRFRLRIILTTRPERDIMPSLSSKKSASIDKDINLQAVDVERRDVRTFIQQELERLQEEDDCTLLSDHPDAVEQLTQLSAGFFLVARIAVKHIRQNPAEASKVFQSMKNEGSPGADGLEALDTVYLQVLRDTEARKSGNAQWRSCIADTLGCIALSQENLSLNTMGGLLDNQKDVVSVLECLKSLVITTTNGSAITFRPLHPSFARFLLDDKLSEEFHVIRGEFSCRLAIACLRLIARLDSDALRSEICGFADPTVTKEGIPDFRKRVQERITPELQYACMHWATHCRDSECTVEFIDALDGFLRTKLLVWFEALSYSGKLESAVATLARIQAKEWPEGPSVDNRDIPLLLRDAHRFVQEFFNLINGCPQHIYISALPLMPHCALLDIYSSHDRHMIRLVTPRPAHWGRCHRVIVADKSVKSSIQYSTKGRWIIGITGAYLKSQYPLMAGALCCFA